MTSSTARKYLVIYVSCVFALSWAWEAVLIANGGLGAFGSLGPFLLMWMPGLVALVFKIACQNKIDPIGWKPRKPRLWLAAYLIPPCVGLIAYGFAWVSGIAPIEIPWDRLAEKFVPGMPGLLAAIGINATIGIIGAGLFALGEEIGWRGVMIQLLVRAKLPHPFLLSGLIWALWHAPVILFGDYATSDMPILSLLLFSMMVASVGVIMGWLTMASLSLWPAVLMHAVHNVFFQGIFDNYTGSTPLSPYMVGESGLLPAIVYTAVAIWIWKTKRAEASIAHFLSSTEVRTKSQV